MEMKAKVPHSSNHSSLAPFLHWGQRRHDDLENTCPMQRVKSIPADWHHVGMQVQYAKYSTFSRETMN